MWATRNSTRKARASRLETKFRYLAGLFATVQDDDKRLLQLPLRYYSMCRRAASRVLRRLSPSPLSNTVISGKSLLSPLTRSTTHYIMVSNHVSQSIENVPVGQHPVGEKRLDLTATTVEVPLASVVPSGVRIPLDDRFLRELAKHPYRLERQKQLLLLDLARKCNDSKTKTGIIAGAARLLYTRSLREVSLAVCDRDDNSPFALT